MSYSTKPTNKASNVIVKLLQIKKLFSGLISAQKRVGRPPKISLPEIVCINWLQARYQNTTLKALYTELKDSFNQFFNLPSYCNFV